jgi:hypothetical protein
VTFANPIAVWHESYIYSENLIITLDEDNALFRGEFVFHSAPLAERHFPNASAYVQIPIWIPTNAHPMQTNLVTFLETFPTNGFYDLNDGNRPILDQTIGLKIAAEENDLPRSNRFGMFTQHDRTARLPVSNKYMRKDVYELYFFNWIDHKILTEGTKVTLNYKQPLIKTGDKALLFYVPIFRNIQPDELNSNIDRYRITIRAPEGYELVPHSTHEYHASPSKTELIIKPKHGTPIVVELKSVANQGIDPTLKTPVDSVND